MSADEETGQVETRLQVVEPLWGYWLQKDLWTILEAAALLAGVEPFGFIHRAHNYERALVSGWADLLPRAVRAGVLRSFALPDPEGSGREVGAVQPSDAVRWARSKGQGVPRVLVDAFSHGPDGPGSPRSDDWILGYAEALHHAELARAEHRSGGEASPAGRERAAALDLKVLGALTIAFAGGRGSRYGTAEKPIIAAIRRAIQAVVTDENGRAPHGFSDSTLDDRLARAVAAARELRGSAD